MSTWYGVMADGEECMRWKFSTNTVDGYKTDTKYAHSVHGRPRVSPKHEARMNANMRLVDIDKLALNFAKLVNQWYSE